MNQGRYITLPPDASLYTPALAAPALADCSCSQARKGLAGTGLADDCWPSKNDIGCYSVGTGAYDLATAATAAVKAGRLPKRCATMIADYLEKALAAEKWSALSGGEYNWLNQIWHALLRNNAEAPPECLMGPAPGTEFDPSAEWKPSPNDPTAPAEVPWGWIVAGVVVAGGTGLYLALHNNKRKKKRR